MMDVDDDGCTLEANVTRANARANERGRKRKREEGGGIGVARVERARAARRTSKTTTTTTTTTTRGIALNMRTVQTQCAGTENGMNSIAWEDSQKGRSGDGKARVSETRGGASEGDDAAPGDDKMLWAWLSVLDFRQTRFQRRALDFMRRGADELDRIGKVLVESKRVVADGCEAAKSTEASAKEMMTVMTKRNDEIHRVLEDELPPSQREQEFTNVMNDKMKATDAENSRKCEFPKAKVPEDIEGKAPEEVLVNRREEVVGVHISRPSTDNSKGKKKGFNLSKQLRDQLRVLHGERTSGNPLFSTPEQVRHEMKEFVKKTYSVNTKNAIGTLYNVFRLDLGGEYAATARSRQQSQPQVAEIVGEAPAESRSKLKRVVDIQTL